MSLSPAPDGYPIKLVRDGTPQIINASGEPGDLWYAPIPLQERAVWLRKKLVEEVAEYVADPGIDELRDILAVIEALAENPHGSSLFYLTNRLRRDPRGGFQDGVMMYGRHPEFDAPKPADARQADRSMAEDDARLADAKSTSKEDR